MQKAAAELGISDRGLAKICSRHRVPNPSRGYWARVAAGQRFKLPPLREIDDPALDRIEITATISHLSENTQEMLRQAKVERAERHAEMVSDPSALSQPVEKPHRAIVATAKALRKAKADEYGCVAAAGTGLCGVIVHSDRIERAVAFLHSLATVLEADGLQLQPDETRMKIVVGQDMVAFTLTEKTRREKHIPTEKEQELYDRQQAKRQRAADRRGWHLYSSLPHQQPWPEYDTIYTGQLAFVVDSWTHGLRKSWTDGKTQSVESMFENIVSGLKVILSNNKSERERREEQERQRAELARRHALAKKRKEREEKRIAYLRELMQLQREASDIRSWLASLPETATADSASDLGRMVQWATGRLADLEALTTVEAAAVQLEGNALFPEIDELHDPMGEPPERKYYW
ncbi:hypothetical protein ACFFJ7_13600 [Pseudochelatococcus lubricantis]|uniref:hypothetical protein n=1 Tax=Pseudochelatococcus lubricantis TaxID=1538102 RepID=UPI0035ECBC31